uniref:Pleckstrin homology-like domain family A member 2 n=1 Tax=Colobus angolensis palliatus TaxID=336983 RepID=A0A2K5J2F2_COLAP
MKSPDEVLREGELEKRSDSLFQLWKKKRGVLTSDRLSLFPASPRARPKELRFHSILKVDCVERTGKYVYFTIVTTDHKEIDFRCAGESCWNAAIALALIDFQNRPALPAHIPPAQPDQREVLSPLVAFCQSLLASARSVGPAGSPLLLGEQERVLGCLRWWGRRQRSLHVQVLAQAIGVERPECSKALPLFLR